MKRITYLEIVENRIFQLKEYISILRLQEQKFLKSKNKNQLNEIQNEIEKAESNLFFMYGEYNNIENE